jgi:hypothetical protein
MGSWHQDVGRNTTLTLTLKVIKLKLKLIYDRLSIGQSALVSGSHLEPMTRILFSVWRLRISWCGAPSLARRWICNFVVQLRLGLARAVNLGSKSRRTKIIFYCLICDSLNSEGQVFVFISPKKRVAQLYPWALCSLFVASYDWQGLHTYFSERHAAFFKVEE